MTDLISALPLAVPTTSKDSVPAVDADLPEGEDFLTAFVLAASPESAELPAIVLPELAQNDDASAEIESAEEAPETPPEIDVDVPAATENQGDVAVVEDKNLPLGAPINARPQVDAPVDEPVKPARSDAPLPGKPTLTHAPLPGRDVPLADPPKAKVPAQPATQEIQPKAASATVDVSSKPLAGQQVAPPQRQPETRPADPLTAMPQATAQQAVATAKLAANVPKPTAPEPEAVRKPDLPLRDKVEAPVAPRNDTPPNAPTAPVTPVVAAQPIPAPPLPVAANPDPDAKAEPSDAAEELASLRGMGPTGSTPATGAQQSFTGPIAARHVASQIAIAVSRNNAGGTELALNPPELGKVRLTLNAQDGAIVLMVQAERPETTDLMRRHIETLSQEFRSLGYSSIKFEFGDSTGNQSQTDGERADGIAPDSGKPDAITAEPDRSPSARSATGGLDLRV